MTTLNRDFMERPTGDCFYVGSDSMIPENASLYFHRAHPEVS